MIYLLLGLGVGASLPSVPAGLSLELGPLRLDLGADRSQCPPPEAQRLVLSGEAFKEGQVFFKAALQSSLEPLVLAALSDVGVHFDRLLVGEPAIPGHQAQADERPLRAHQCLGRLVAVACRTPRPKLFGGPQRPEHLQFFGVPSELVARFPEGGRQLVQADRPLRQYALPQQVPAEGVADRSSEGGRQAPLSSSHPQSSTPRSLKTSRS